MKFLTYNQQKALMEQAVLIVTDEEKARALRLLNMTEGESMVMCSAIECMIRKQGAAKTREDILAMVSSMERIIKYLDDQIKPVS